MTKGFFSALGAVVSAVFGSFCCFGPFAAAALGITGAGFTQSFKPYRPWLIGVTMALIGFGFYAVYGRSSASCGAQGAQELVLWLATVVVLLLLLFPYYIPLIV